MQTFCYWQQQGASQQKGDSYFVDFEIFGFSAGARNCAGSAPLRNCFRFPSYTEGQSL
jgi:hypothetical protein